MRFDNYPTRKYSKRQEQNIAKFINGKCVANSGATPFAKGDITAGSFLIEAKTAMEEKKSFSIKHEWLIKLKEEAFSMRKPFYALAFNFGGFNNKENYYIIDEQLFKRVKELLEEDLNG